MDGWLDCVDDDDDDDSDAGDGDNNDSDNYQGDDDVDDDEYYGSYVVCMYVAVSYERTELKRSREKGWP